MVLLAVLHLLKQNSFDNRISDRFTFKVWETQMKEQFPSYYYWGFVMTFIENMLDFVGSLRIGDWHLYRESLQTISPWFFIFDHKNYCRWVPVRLRDIDRLPEKNPDLVNFFGQGEFACMKSDCPFLPRSWTRIMNSLMAE